MPPVGGSERRPAEGIAAPHPPTPEQAAAIDARRMDVFLEAGAGTGKTRVLVSRYCDAIDVDGVEPERMLAFTFTERAAGEMRRRVRIELARRATEAADPERRARLLAASRVGESMPVTTIHGYCRRLLAAHPIAAGLDPRFRVLDAEEASRLASEAYEAALSELAATDADVVATAASYRWRLGGIIRAAHADLRNRGERRPELPPIQFTAIDGDAVASPAELEQASSAYGAIQRLLVAYGDRYEQLCAERSGLDFDHLQLLALELLRRNVAIAAGERERFDHLLVDEFQDTSPIQIELVRMLRGESTRLFAVGDEFQSIYAFRGADLASFRRERARLREAAEARPDSAAVLPLSGSFRSDPDVVGAVNAVGGALLDDFRELRVGKLPDGPPPGPAGEPAIEILLTRRREWGEADNRIPTARADASPARVAEARFLAQRLRELADGGVDPSGMVVLLRAFTNVDIYAEALELSGLEPHVVGGRGYWSAQQVTDALNLLACVANPLDDEPLLGALASPACGAGPDALWILRRISGGRAHLWPTLEQLFGEPRGSDAAGEGGEPSEHELALRQRRAEWEPRIAAGDRERLSRFVARLAALRAIASSLPLDTLVERTLETFDYDLATLLMDQGRRRTANLRKLVRIATEYEAHDGRDLRGFLDHAAARAAFSDRESEAAAASEDHAGVRVMTIHAAKGLEFETVAVADLGRKLTAGGQPPELRIDFEDEEIAAAAGEEPPPARVGLRLARAAAASIDTEGYRSLGEAAGDAEAEESGRLVYVAASRAERRLLLSGVYDDSDLEEAEPPKPPKPRRTRTALGCLLPRLGVDGEDGQRIRMAAPSARAGLDSAEDFPEVEAVVRVIGAGTDTAARLARDLRERGEQPEPGEAASAALSALEESAGAAAARNLSYSSLAAFERCGYRFLTERVLGLGGREAAAIPESTDGRVDDAGSAIAREWDERPAPPGDEGQGAGAGEAAALRSRMGFGRAVHELLEWSARNDWALPDERTRAAALAREGGAADADARLTAMLEGWLSSPLLGELRASGAALRPEVSFRLALEEGTILRGTLDLLDDPGLTGPGPDPAEIITVVDYKTDRLRGRAPELDAGYELQRSLYAAAVAAATGARSVRAAYVFLERPDEPVVATLGPDEIEVGRERIEAVVARIRAGHFEATREPHHDLCHDCPARARLCPHPRELTGRASR
ncbi:MAG: UvrD-helicase domain-containing protein [Solirubrobacterales bacterium]